MHDSAAEGSYEAKKQGLLVRVYGAIFNKFSTEGSMGYIIHVLASEIVNVHFTVPDMYKMDEDFLLYICDKLMDHRFVSRVFANESNRHIAQSIDSPTSPDMMHNGFMLLPSERVNIHVTVYYIYTNLTKCQGIRNVGQWRNFEFKTGEAQYFLSTHVHSADPDRVLNQGLFPKHEMALRCTLKCMRALQRSKLDPSVRKACKTTFAVKVYELLQDTITRNVSVCPLVIPDCSPVHTFMIILVDRLVQAMSLVRFDDDGYSASEEVKKTERRKVVRGFAVYMFAHLHGYSFPNIQHNDDHRTKTMKLWKMATDDTYFRHTTTKVRIDPTRIIQLFINACFYKAMQIYMSIIRSSMGEFDNAENLTAAATMLDCIVRQDYHRFEDIMFTLARTIGIDKVKRVFTDIFQVMNERFFEFYPTAGKIERKSHIESGDVIAEMKTTWLHAVAHIMMARNQGGVPAAHLHDPSTTEVADAYKKIMVTYFPSCF